MLYFWSWLVFVISLPILFSCAWTISCSKNLKMKSEGTNQPQPFLTHPHRKTWLYPCVWCKTLCKNFETLSHGDQNGKARLFCSLCCTTSYKVEHQGSLGSGKPSSLRTLPSFKAIPVARPPPQLCLLVDFLFHFCTALHLLCALFFFSLSVSVFLSLSLSLSPTPPLPDPVASAAVGFLTLLTTTRLIIQSTSSTAPAADQIPGPPYTASGVKNTVTARE